MPYKMKSKGVLNMCKKNTMDFAPTVDFKEQTPDQQISRSEPSELYRKAWLENDTGVSNEFCQNTTSWD